MAGDRAWRFLHPDFDIAEEWAGLQFSPTGGIQMVEGNEGVRQALVLLLSTSPGERVMRPGYGCELRRLIFSPNDETTAGLAIHYVRKAIERWEPRVEILRLDAYQVDVAPERLAIALDYRVRTTNRTTQLQVALDLAGGAV